ncbi:hypothetical protein WBG78_20795 [Chryseolinea sp. T2]|uniref:hypothetical protein n=1 Tax=Chryseolinea sp. T2 TaxID=3129255 RepID=UPI003076B152
MSKEQIQDLLKFLRPFSKEIQSTVFWLRDFVWDLYPKANELIYDDYNALAFGWSPTDRVGHTFCSIAVGRTSKNIHFGFYWGSEIDDPKRILTGEGKQYRYVLVEDVGLFPRVYIEKLLKQAYATSLKKVKDKGQIRSGLTITKSVSEKKRVIKAKKVGVVKKVAKKGLGKMTKKSSKEKRN